MRRLSAQELPPLDRKKNSNEDRVFVSPLVVLPIGASTARHRMYFLSLYSKELKDVAWGVGLRRTGRIIEEDL